ncbi:hypothetical protein DNM76_08225 [Salmonella enterica subsp. enterica]|nr:hypothetical protein [Salmonella enterica subsp. enterica serovar Praha]ECD2132292.1 hypothetical protein [Salmonella enterica subsp. enterica serovar Praha]MJN50053.1 hypothetical protein [Salmonella enterica subsp. enterica serovar Praha]
MIKMLLKMSTLNFGSILMRDMTILLSKMLRKHIDGLLTSWEKKSGLSEEIMFYDIFAPSLSGCIAVNLMFLFMKKILAWLFMMIGSLGIYILQNHLQIAQQLMNLHNPLEFGLFLLPSGNLARS